MEEELCLRELLRYGNRSLICGFACSSRLILDELGVDALVPTGRKPLLLAWENDRVDRTDESPRRRFTDMVAVGSGCARFIVLCWPPDKCQVSCGGQIVEKLLIVVRTAARSIVLYLQSPRCFFVSCQASERGRCRFSMCVMSVDAVSLLV